MNDENVKEYFDRIAEEFDNIYDNKGSFSTRISNRLFRKGMHERIAIALKECGDLENKSVLDIGCGSGRISFMLAEKGAKVTGIDYSNSMIDLAKKYQLQFKNNSIQFNCCDFMQDFPDDKQYDISIVLGVFDYIEDPIPFLSKVRKITTNKIISSFPARFSIQSPLRKIWLKKRNCPVFFYTENSIKKIYSNIGLNNIKIIRVPQGTLSISGYAVLSELN